ncbi:Chromate transporter [Rhodovastum atsumiense]|uniref:Chromate transporter n=1 Tax=Rhodovastum atsumiense TaxID=504468 RepID=A0A5M6IPF7_9PROT|nr:chromate transporter [Rhodovastum atsumiense]KAA5610160.1 chromate transporter [Rhodovastum atsumiense]CAH2599253.1 Chromate transporter [Rhodovastum atsumiense]
MHDTRPPAAPPQSALQLFIIFSRIGLTSFGGGLSGWFFREFVRDRGWMTEEEFLNGLSLAQALPGVNVTNMAIWIGYRLLGVRGGVAGLLGIVVPPAILIIVLAVGFAAVARFPLTHLALDGAAAAAIGLSLSMGITAAWRVPRRAFPLATMAATFVAVGLLHWPLPWVVLVGGTVSVGITYLRLARA